MTVGARTIPVLDTVVDDTGFGALETEWDQLIGDSDAGGIFLTWAWLSSWRETLGRCHDLRIVTARHPDDGSLVAVAPLAVERRTRGGIPHRVLVMAGSGPLTPDHLDIAVRCDMPPSIAADLWEWLTRESDWDLIDLDGLREDGHLARLLLRRVGDRRSSERTACPYLELPGTWEEYEQGLSKSHRQSIRRYRRKLGREAPAPVSTRLAIGAEDIDETMARLGALHQKIRTAQGDAGAFATDEAAAFHRTAARRFADAGRLRLHRLDVGSDTVAAILCYRFGNTVAFYTTGYDPDWSRYGPGRTILAHAIASAIGEGAEVFDLLRGNETYKERWKPVVRHNLRIRRPVGVKGRVLWGGGVARSIMRGFRSASE